MATALPSTATRLSFYGRYGAVVFAPGGGRGAVDHDKSVLVCPSEGWRSVGRFWREGGRLRFAGTAPPFGGGQGGTHELVISESGRALEGTFTPSGGSAASVKFTRSPPPDCPPWLELQAAADALRRPPSSAGGKTRSFVHILESLVVKELEGRELEDVLCALLKGAPVVEPWGIVLVRGAAAAQAVDGTAAAIVEPKLNTLDAYWRKAAASPHNEARTKCRASFGEMVDKLRQASVAGDFKLANVLEDRGKPGALVCTDLAPYPWGEFAGKVAAEGGRVQDYCSFDKRLEHWLAEQAPPPRR